LVQVGGFLGGTHLYEEAGRREEGGERRREGGRRCGVALGQ